MSESKSVGDLPRCQYCEKIFIENSALRSHEWGCDENPDGNTPGVPLDGE